MYSEFHCATTVVDSIVTRFSLPQKSDLHYCFAFTAQSAVIADRWREAFYKILPAVSKHWAAGSWAFTAQMKR
jgi:hypothetical protein